jgi:hypothetical protein
MTARRDPAQIYATLPRATIDRIEHLAIDLHCKRTEAIEVLIEAGFERLAERDGEREED